MNTVFRLNMRTAFNTYRQLGKFLEEVDAAAQAQGKAEDTSIDSHFRSGVYLGVGMSNLVLSMMPSRLLALIELFGYKGDRHVGLEMLYKAGGWTQDSDEPSVSCGTVKESRLRMHVDLLYQSKKASVGPSATWVSLYSISFSPPSPLTVLT